MPEGTDLAITVTSDDPKQKKTEDKKEDAKTGSKATDDVKKDGEGEELVSSRFIGNEYVLIICTD
jgi:hypothetical protein